MTKPEVPAKKEKKPKKAWVYSKECVACGVCVKQCPREAIAIQSGSYAAVREELCVGCGLCAKSCPACVIEIREIQHRNEENYETT